MEHGRRFKVLLAWGLAIAASLGVFAMYTRPEFLITLADQVWGCF